MDRKEFGCFPVVSVAPHLLTCGGFGQLHGDTDAIAEPADAALDHEADIQLARDAGDRDDGSLVLERAQSGADLQQSPPGKLGDDVLAETVTERILRGIAI